MKRRRKVRKWRRQFATWLTAVSDAVASMSASAGVFRHRGVLVLHPGLLIDQIGVAAAIDQAIDESGANQGVELVRGLLGRVTLRIYGKQFKVGTVWLDQHAVWQGGRLDRGMVRIRYDKKWKRRIYGAMYSLLQLDSEDDD